MNFFQKILNKIDWWYNTYQSRKLIDMPYVKVLNFDESIEAIIKNESSLTRFGDGELSLVLNGEFLRKRNKPLRFQWADPKIKIRLEEVLTDPNVEQYNLKVAISSAIISADTVTYTDEAWHFWKNFMIENRYKIYQKLRKGYPYIDTLITRFYMDYRDKSVEVMAHKVSQLKRLWHKKDLLIVEGNGSRLGLNNDLFDNVSSIERLVCPNANAFDKYEKILEESKRCGRNKLIIIALGPTATVLAYDLAKAGMRALDLGHIDIEYEWFLMKAETKVPVKGKVMTEVLDDKEDVQLINTEDIYRKQVISSVD